MEINTTTGKHLKFSKQFFEHARNGLNYSCIIFISFHLIVFVLYHKASWRPSAHLCDFGVSFQPLEIMTRSPFNYLLYYILF